MCNLPNKDFEHSMVSFFHIVESLNAIWGHLSEVVEEVEVEVVVVEVVDEVVEVVEVEVVRSRRSRRHAYYCIILTYSFWNSSFRCILLLMKCFWLVRLERQVRAKF